MQEPVAVGCGLGHENALSNEFASSLDACRERRRSAYKRDGEGRGEQCIFAKRQWAEHDRRRLESDFCCNTAVLGRVM